MEAHEIEPWAEAGEQWRRLAVSFPPNLPNHNPWQVFCYDGDFLLRRMDYSLRITGGSQVAHYTHEPRSFDGFVFYDLRPVHLRDDQGVANHDFAPITLSTHDVTVERR